MSNRPQDNLEPNPCFSSEDSPLHRRGFRYYVPTEHPMRTPLFILGFEVDERGDAAIADTSPLIEAVYGPPVVCPLAWEPGDLVRDKPWVRALHQCGGDQCLQRAVIGFPLMPTEGTKWSVEHALSALSYDNPLSLSSLGIADSRLRETTVQKRGGGHARTMSLNIDRTYRRCVEAFMVIDLPDDTAMAADLLRPMFEDDLPLDLSQMFAPRADVRIALNGRLPDFSGLCLFALDLNSD